MNHQINRLINFALQKGMIQTVDVEYSVNLLLALFKLDSFECEEIDETLVTSTPILEEMLDYAQETGIIEATQTAQQNALKAQQELEISKAEAEKKIVEAQAEADANKIKTQSIDDKNLQQKFLEKWNGELPKVVGEGENIFDLSNIMKGGN